MKNNLVVIKGAGEMASAIAHRLMMCHFPVVMTEREKPSVIRRTVSFAQAIFTDRYCLQNICAQRAIKEDIEGIKDLVAKNIIPVVVDEAADIIKAIKPAVVIDAIIAKRNVGTSVNDAPLVIGIGPGFTAPKDVHFVIESNRGHNLAKIISRGQAQTNTSTPGNIAGVTSERLLRAPVDGIFKGYSFIGAPIEKGNPFGQIEDQIITAKISGIVRGIIADGHFCKKRTKVGDIDPRNKIEYCFCMSEKARNISGAVLEVIVRNVKAY
ncbi:selenium-dependent molybdenum cofactor biosynthesis protein YqeB [Candidatus Uabimicrobium sp. HlEnr_7]|uniref:selenium-dependent molybdenum cofactor biosynthesis protein YqeB n=1 Tax=Candidatus Uabimicrobium helgolandensis TaxID=3095367 RepID=UPI0035567BE7